MKMTQCEIGKIELIDFNVLLVTIDSGVEVGVEHLYEFNNVAKDLARKKKLYSIVDYGAYSLPSKEARAICAQEETNDSVIARAIVVHDLGQVILAKHDIRKSKSNVPIRVFMQLDKAKQWVDEMRKNSLVSA